MSSGISKRSIGRFSEKSKENVEFKKKKKKQFENSNITNLLQIIQTSKHPPEEKDQEEEKKEKEDKTLRMVHMDLTFNCAAGQKICLMGRHNSGCSELLLTICGETIIKQGKFFFNI